LARSRLVGLCSAVVGEGKEEKVDDRIRESATVIKEILDVPDGIPKDLLNKADCVVIYPSVKKAALASAAATGGGLITCRTGRYFSGSWSAPAMLRWKPEFRFPKLERRPPTSCCW